MELWWILICMLQISIGKAQYVNVLKVDSKLIFFKVTENLILISIDHEMYFNKIACNLTCRSKDAFISNNNFKNTHNFSRNFSLLCTNDALLALYLNLSMKTCNVKKSTMLINWWSIYKSLVSHDDLLLKADLPLLSKRRDFATLCQLFKIVYKLCSSPNPYNPHPRPGLRNLNSMALDTPFCRLSLTQKSFYPYAPSLWNYLPDSTVKCPTLTAFKSAISQLFC